MMTEPTNTIPPVSPASDNAGLAAWERPAETVQLREFIALVRRKFWLILGVTTTVVGLSSFLALRAKPSFKANGAIRLSNVRQEVAGGLANEDRPGSVGSYNDPLKTQIQVLTSRTVAAAVVERIPALLLQPKGFSPALLDSVSVTHTAKPESLSVHFERTRFSVIGARGKASAAYDSVLNYPGVKFTLTGAPKGDTGSLQARLIIMPRDAAISKLVGGLKATPRQESDVIDVEYTAEDPLTAQRGANAVIEAFRDISAENSQQQSRRRRVFVEEQLRQNDSTLAVAQSALASFRSREQTFGTKEKFNTEQAGLLGLTGQREVLASDRTLYNSLLEKLQDVRAGAMDEGLRTLISTPGITANPVIEQLYGQLVKFQTARDSMTTGPYSAAKTNPDVQRIDTLLAATQGRLVGALRSHVASLSARIAVLDSVKVRSATALSRLPVTEAEEMRLTNQAETIRKMGDQLREEYQRAKISEAVQIGQVEVVDLAASPGRPVGSGKFPKILVGLLVGLVLGVGAGYVTETLDTSINRRDEVEELLHVPTLSVLPRGHTGNSKFPARDTLTPAQNGTGAFPSTNGKKRRKSEGSRHYGLVHEVPSGSPDLEAYITLRTNLLLSPGGRKMRRLVVTSPAPRDGKTTVAANLAIAFAQHGSRTLLVDCDFRRPRVHYAFGVRSSPGFTDAVLGTAPLADVIQPSAIENLYLLAVGSRTDSPSQLLASEAARDVIVWLGQQVDIVILDSPPVLAVADAAMIGAQSDGVLLVVRAGSTARDEAQTAARQLAGVGARLVGVALNDPDNIVPQYSPYYYNYYQYYSTGASKRS